MSDVCKGASYKDSVVGKPIPMLAYLANTSANYKRRLSSRLQQTTKEDSLLDYIHSVMYFVDRGNNWCDLHLGERT
jgi:hypothetical protein